MAHSSGLITAPARLVEDVRSVLGFSPRSDGKYYLEDACLSSAINIWAKYKPVRLQTWDTSSQWDYSNNRWKSSANWFHGMGNRIFGLTAYYNSNLEYVINAYDGGMNGWTYDRPNGYYRLSDFAQYDHYAQAPVSGFACTSEMQNGGTFNAQISRIAYSSSDNNVHIEDFVSGGSYLYFGVAIVNSSGGIVKRFTASSPSGCDISTTLTGISDGNYKVYPFLSLYYISPSSTDISANTYYSIPLVDYANLRIGTTSAGSIEASCGSGTIVSWKIYLNRASVPSSSTIYLYTTGGSIVDYWTLSSSNWSTSDNSDKGRYMAVSGSSRTFTITGSPESYYLKWTGGGDTITGMISYSISTNEAKLTVQNAPVTTSGATTIEDDVVIRYGTRNSSGTYVLSQMTIQVYDANDSQVLNWNITSSSTGDRATIWNNSKPGTLWSVTNDWNFKCDISVLGYTGNENYTILVYMYYIPS